MPYCIICLNNDKNKNGGGGTGAPPIMSYLNQAMEPLNVPLKLKFVKTDNCFVGLSIQLWDRLGLRRIGSIPIISVQQFGSESVWYFTVDPVTFRCGAPDEVAIGSQLGSRLNLREDEYVLVKKYQGSLPLAKRVWAEPDHISDWEIIVLMNFIKKMSWNLTSDTFQESNSSSVELEFLNQLRAVQVGLNPVIFVGNVPASLIISNNSSVIGGGYSFKNLSLSGEIEPEAAVVLMTNDTEVMIEPKDRLHASLPAATSVNSGSQKSPRTAGSMLTKVQNLFSSYVEGDADVISEPFQNWTKIPVFGRSFRVIQLRESVKNHHLCCFMSSKDVDEGSTALISVKRIDFDLEDACDENAFHGCKALKAHVSENVHIPRGSIAFSVPFLAAAGLKVGDRVQIGQADISEAIAADDTFQISATNGQGTNLCEDDDIIVIPNLSLLITLNDATRFRLKTSHSSLYFKAKDQEKYIRQIVDDFGDDTHEDDR